MARRVCALTEVHKRTDRVVELLHALPLATAELVDHPGILGLQGEEILEG